MFEHVPADTLTCVRLFARVAAGTVLGILIAGLPGGSRSPAQMAPATLRLGWFELARSPPVLMPRASPDRSVFAVEPVLRRDRDNFITKCCQHS